MISNPTSRGKTSEAVSLAALVKLSKTGEVVFLRRSRSFGRGVLIPGVGARCELALGGRPGHPRAVAGLQGTSTH
jgi:hypothetical protein